MDRERSSIIEAQQDMDRQRRITIRYFLNKEVQAINFNGVEYYPLYVKILVNGINTRFRVPLKQKDKYYSENDLLDTENGIGFTAELTKDLEKIIRYEFETIGLDYRLSGFRKRLERYLSNFPLHVNNEAFKIVDKIYNQTDSFTTEPNLLDKKYLCIPFEKRAKLLTEQEKTVIATAFYLEEYNYKKDIKLYKWMLTNTKRKFLRNTQKNADNQSLASVELQRITCNNIEVYINKEIEKLIPKLK